MKTLNKRLLYTSVLALLSFSTVSGCTMTKEKTSGTRSSSIQQTSYRTNDGDYGNHRHYRNWFHWRGRNETMNQDGQTQVPNSSQAPLLTPQPVPNNTPNTTNQNNVPNTANQNTTPSTNQSLSDYQNQVIQLTNKQRQNNGLPPLKADASLSKVATTKAKDMASNNYFSHTSPTYGSPFQMMKHFGISYTTAEENIAAGQKTPQAVVDAWMKSPGHRANILNKDVTYIGVGYAKGGSMGTYWSQMFIKK